MTSRYLPPGRCIYCDAPENLTREHIIPAGLGGNWVLPEASCRRCAAKTSAAELHVMRVMLGDFRATAGVGSSRRKKPMTRDAIRVADESSAPMGTGRRTGPKCLGSAGPGIAAYRQPVWL
ncbi:HNH endonuclease [Cupriavidus necator]|uniref:HNH endonuclease n=1 Tax=Cupriavidus necator TaxID=106590 RepID=UPI0009B82361